jgi:NADH:ubiquinone oxidoreductase subunit K
MPLLFDFYVAVGKSVGIMTPTSVFFLLAILGLMLLSLQATLAASAAYTHRKALTQQFALLENRVAALEQAARRETPQSGNLDR